MLESTAEAERNQQPWRFNAECEQHLDPKCERWARPYRSPTYLVLAVWSTQAKTRDADTPTTKQFGRSEPVPEARATF